MIEVNNRGMVSGSLPTALFIPVCMFFNEVEAMEGCCNVVFQPGGGAPNTNSGIRACLNILGGQ